MCVCVYAVFFLYICWLCTLISFSLLTSSVPQVQTPHSVLISWRWWASLSKWGHITKGENSEGGPTVLCTDAELLSGTGCCGLLHDNHSTSKSPQAHFTVWGKNATKNPLHSLQRHTCTLMYLLGEGSLTLGWRSMTNRQRQKKKKKERTETCHVDNFLTLPLTASGRNLPSGLKPLKLI